MCLSLSSPEPVDKNTSFIRETETPALPCLALIVLSDMNSPCHVNEELLLHTTQTHSCVQQGELQSCLYSHVPKPALAVCPFDSEPVDGAIQNVHVSHSDFLCMFVFPSGRDRAEDSTE